MPATKTHPACTIYKDGMWLPLWMDYKTVTYAHISPKMVNSKDIAQNAEEKEETYKTWDQHGKQRGTSLTKNTVPTLLLCWYLTTAKQKQFNSFSQEITGGKCDFNSIKVYTSWALHMWLKCNMHGWHTVPLPQESACWSRYIVKWINCQKLRLVTSLSLLSLFCSAAETNSLLLKG